MKKIFEKHGVVNCVGALMDVIAFILFIVAAFVDGATADMVLKVVGLVLFVVAIVRFVFSALAPDTNANGNTKNTISGCIDCFINNSCN